MKTTFVFATAALVGMAGVTLLPQPKPAQAQEASPEQVGEAIAFGVKVLGAAREGLLTECTRHFYNKSSVTWEVRGSPGSGFCEQAGSCVVGPGQTGAINYPIVRDGTRIRLIGDGGNTYNEEFPVEAGKIIVNGNCAYIRHHRANTGRAVLNDPADGDIVALN